MKYTCSCGFQSNSTQEFYTHIAQDSQQHRRIVESSVAAAAPTPKAESASPQPAEKRERKVPAFDFRNRWVIIGAGVGGFLLSLLLGSMWLENSNIVLGLLVVVLFFGCPVLIWRTARNGGGFRKHTSRVVRPVELQGSTSTSVTVTENLPVGRGVSHEAADLSGEINAFKVYVRKGDPSLGENPLIPVLAEFCHAPPAELLGQPRQLRNDKKWYHLLIVGPEVGALRPVTVGDGTFMDPHVMARYLDAPCQRSYIEFVRETMTKWIGPGMLALMDGILLLVIYLRATAA